MGPQLYLMLALAAAGPATYAVMKVKQAVAVHAAVKDTRAEGIRACNVRVVEIETLSRKAVENAEREARAAAERIGDTPVGDELKKLCKVSASCRSRGSL